MVSFRIMVFFLLNLLVKKFKNNLDNVMFSIGKECIKLVWVLVIEKVIFIFLMILLIEFDVMVNIINIR